MMSRCSIRLSASKPANSLRNAFGKKYHLVFADIPRAFFKPCFLERMYPLNI